MFIKITRKNNLKNVWTLGVLISSFPLEFEMFHIMDICQVEIDIRQSWTSEKVEYEVLVCIFVV